MAVVISNLAEATKRKTLEVDVLANYVIYEVSGCPSAYYF